MTLTPTADRVLGDLQPELQDDGDVQQVLQALANETDRIDTIAQDIRVKAFPQNADDTYKTLSMLEDNLGLPVAPPGSTIAGRRNLVLAHIQKRNVGPGSVWEEVVAQALGGYPFSYQEGPADDTVTVRIPYASGSLTAAQVALLVRSITPAHIDLIPAYDEGFLVEISQVEIEPL